MKRVIGILFFILVSATCAFPMSVDSGEELKVIAPAESDPSEKPSLCLVGDSRVYLWPPAYFKDEYEVTNLGVSGTTSIYSMYRIAMQTKKYDVMIISVGLNDKPGGMSLNESLTALASCLFQAKFKASKVYITTIPGLCALPGVFPDNVHPYTYRAAQVNTFIPTIAANFGAEVIDIASLLCEGWSLKTEYHDGGGAHYSAAGYAALYALYQEKLTK